MRFTRNEMQYYEPVLGYGTHGAVFVIEAEPGIMRGYGFPLW
jgi:hypothetical protein